MEQGSGELLYLQPWGQKLPGFSFSNTNPLQTCWWQIFKYGSERIWVTPG